MDRRREDGVVFPKKTQMLSLNWQFLLIRILWIVLDALTRGI